MNRLVFVLLLVSAPAWAEWTPISRNDDIGVSIYVDLASIRKRAETILMWSLYDFKTSQGTAKPYLSTKTQDEFDCVGERSRTLFYTFHSRNMGSGTLVTSNGVPSEWAPVPPSSIVEALWKVACKP